MRTFAEDAATVRRLAAQHIPTPEHRRAMIVAGEADALGVDLDALPRPGGMTRLGDWALARGYAHADDPTWRKAFHGRIVMRLMAASQARAGR